MTKTIIGLAVATVIFAGCSGDKTTKEVHKTHTKHWSYSGEDGPAHWSKVSATCGEGKMQSPINIISKDVIGLQALNILEFHEATKAEPSHEIDNGHAIKITPSDDHGMSINGVHYKLLQFHFHGKSENRIDGKQFAMEMHLVHQNAKGELAVVGVMVEEGAHNKYLEGIVDHLDGGDLNIATNDILPKDKTHYYHFMGSLTTPPCSENVSWYIMKDTISLDAKQLAAFRSHHRDNFRPIQATNARPIEYK